MHSSTSVAIAATTSFILLLARYRRRRRRRFLILNSSACRSRLEQLILCHTNLIPTENGDGITMLLWSNSVNAGALAMENMSTVHIFSHLVGSNTALENKAVMGKLLMDACATHGGAPPPVIENYLLHNKQQFEIWLRDIGLSSQRRRRRWVLKDAMSNGGHGLWFLDFTTDNTTTSLTTALSQMNPSAMHTVQLYVENPMLWHGRKFHLRVAAVFLGSGQVFVHRHAFLHPANKQFIQAFGDPSVHITNLGVNLANKNDGDAAFIGEQDVDLPTMYPNVWMNILHAVAFLCVATERLMLYQRSPRDFEYVGLDFLLDQQDNVWLIEANCPPAMTSPTGKDNAERLHEEILRDLLTSFVMDVNTTTLWRGGFCACMERPRRRYFSPSYKMAKSLSDLSLKLYLKRAAAATTKQSS